MVRKLYIKPIKREPAMLASSGIIIARNGLSAVSAGMLPSYRKAPITPLIPPTYIIPGIPRLRFPDFSVRISPVHPKSSGMLCIIALCINEISIF